MNRVVTLVGRAEACKLHLNGDDIAGYHCGLVLTPQGLWVVDLLSREGTYINGMPVRCERLREGDELQLGKYALRFWFRPRPQS